MILFDKYGEYKTLADYLKRDIRFGCKKLFWLQGWLGKEYNYDYVNIYHIAFTSTDFELKQTIPLVHREDQANVVRKSGFINAQAIGSPFCYLTNPIVYRIPGSLLVMPIHSHSDWPQKWDENAYIEYILSVKKFFKKVTVCCHDQCFQNGVWVNKFKDAGFNVVCVSKYGDTNSMRKIAELFLSHEYLNTNGFGSHWVYGAFYGCKVSVSDKFCSFDWGDYISKPENVPDLVKKYGWSEYKAEFFKKVMDLQSKEQLKKRYPKLFLDPFDAKENIEWAREELGYEFKKTPAELMQIIGYSYFRDAYWRARFFAGKMKKVVQNINHLEYEENK